MNEHHSEVCKQLRKVTFNEWRNACNGIQVSREGGGEGEGMINRVTYQLRLADSGLERSHTVEICFWSGKVSD